MDERYLDIGQSSEMPERIRMATPNSAPDTGKTARRARSEKSETGVRRLRKRIVLRTHELGSRT